MSRDMQLGLVLAVGFLAIVGGVLYYRIEHPDDLEQFWNSPEQVAQAPRPAAPGEPGKDADPGHLAAPPAAAPPALGNAPSLDAKSEPSSGNSGVVLTGATGARSPAPESPPLSDVKIKLDPGTVPTATKPEASKATTSPPSPTFTLDLPKQDPPKQEKVKSEPPKPTPPAMSSHNAQPTPTKPESPAPAPALRQSFPSDVASLPKASTTPPPASPPLFGAAPPAAPSLGSDVPKPKDDKTLATPLGKETKPAPAAPNLGGTATGTSFPTPPAPALSSTMPSLASAGVTGTGNHPTPPAPPPASGIPSVPKELPKTPEFEPSPASSVKPATEIKPTPPPAPLDQPSRDSISPKASLGRPVPENDSTQRERRWAESSGMPSPVVPSAAQVPVRGNPINTTTIAGERRVTSDVYVPWEYAVKGETFSSLSQRLYGETNYAAALAAYNRDEGFVETDQPETNKRVAKPNREILDLKYPRLVRPASRPAVARNSAVPGAPGRATVSTRTDPPVVPTGDLPIYRVSKDEQLFDVAKKTLGDGYRWSEIYALNKDQLRDSAELRADMILKLPADAKVDGTKPR